MRALAAVLVVLQLLAALGMFALSVHAPSGLALSAPLYAVASAAFTWWAARSRSWALLVLAGVATLAGPPEERTRGAYDMATLYRNVVASGLPACKVPGQ